MPHAIFTLLAASLLALAMAMAGDRSPRERLHAAARVLFCCMMTLLGGSWLMHLIDG